MRGWLVTIGISLAMVGMVCAVMYERSWAIIPIALGALIVVAGYVASDKYHG